MLSLRLVLQWTFKNKTGVSPALHKIVITELVEVARKEQAPV